MPWHKWKFLLLIPSRYNIWISVQVTACTPTLMHIFEHTRVAASSTMLRQRPPPPQLFQRLWHPFTGICNTWVRCYTIVFKPVDCLFKSKRVQLPLQQFRKQPWQIMSRLILSRISLLNFSATTPTAPFACLHSAGLVAATNTCAAQLLPEVTTWNLLKVLLCYFFK